MKRNSLFLILYIITAMGILLINSLFPSNLLIVGFFINILFIQECLQNKKPTKSRK